VHLSNIIVRSQRRPDGPSTAAGGIERRRIRIDLSPTRRPFYDLVTREWRYASTTIHMTAGRGGNEKCELRPATEDAAVAASLRSAVATGMLPTTTAGLRPRTDGSVHFGSTDPDAPWTTVAVEENVICARHTGRADATTRPRHGELFASMSIRSVGVGSGGLMAELAPKRRRSPKRSVGPVGTTGQRFYDIEAGPMTPTDEEIWGVSVDEICYRRHA